MSNTIYLEPSQVPSALRGAYRGNKFQASVCETVHIPMTAGLWDGGSRDLFSAIRMTDGATVPFPGQQAAPWDNGRRDRTVTLEPGIAVVEHSIFCGKDMGLRFYVHPADAVRLLPGPVGDLDPVEQLVLNYTVGRKSSYNGRDRFQMAVSDLRDGYTKRNGIERLDRAIWDAAKERLIGKGLLNKAGAVTVAGRNAAGRV